MNKNHRKALEWVIFFIYVIVLFYVVFFAEGMGRAESASGYKYNLQFMTEIKRYVVYLGRTDTLGRIAFFNIFGNILAFVPLGVFLPMLSCRKLKGVVTLVIGFALSLSIESVQLIFRVGCFDVDDVFLNVTGAFVGYICYVIVSCVYRYAHRIKKK